MEQSKQEKEIYELAELLMKSENLEASATILRDFAEKCYQEGAIDELEFENRKKKIAAFKIELKTLMAKYNFGKAEKDNYNGMDEYCGTDYYFTIDGEAWYSETIAEILDEVVGSH